MRSRQRVAANAAEAAVDAIREEIGAFDGVYQEKKLNQLAEGFEYEIRDNLEHGLARLHSDKHDTELVTDGGEPDVSEFSSPDVVDLEMDGWRSDEITEITVTVQYWSHRPEGHEFGPYRSEISFEVEDGVATFLDSSGEGYTSDQMSAIITACEVVRDHPEISAVRGTQSVSGAAMKFIGKCQAATQDNGGDA